MITAFFLPARDGRRQLPLNLTVSSNSHGSEVTGEDKGEVDVSTEDEFGRGGLALPTQTSGPKAQPPAGRDRALGTQCVAHLPGAQRRSSDVLLLGRLVVHRVYS